MKQFNIDNFNIISVKRRGEAEMHLNARYLTFTKSLLEEMGCPQYVQLLINAQTSVLALKACKATDENAYKFSQPRGMQKTAKYCSSNPVKKSIFAAMGNVWNGDGFYGCRGTYFQEQKVMVFDLKGIYKRNV